MAALVLGAIGIAWAAIFVRLREDGLGLSATAFWRLALAWPFFLACSRTERRRHAELARPSGWRQMAVLLLPGVFFACDLGVWHWSIHLTTAANATLFANCAPMVVSVVAWLWLRERLRGVFAVGLALAMMGVALVVRSSAGEGAGSPLGDGLGLVTAVFYAAYQLSVKRARARYSTATIMTWAIPSACAVLAVVSAASGETFLAVTARGWLVLLGLAVVCQIGGQGLIAYSLAHLPASFSSVSLLIQPVAAALFAWVILREALGPIQALGGALVLAGIVLARRGSREDA